MLITKTSILTGKTHTIDLPVTQEQLDRWRHDRVLIQHAMPELTAAEREFILYGITPEEWAKEFCDEDAREHHGRETDGRG